MHRCLNNSLLFMFSSKKVLDTFADPQMWSFFAQQSQCWECLLRSAIHNWLWSEWKIGGEMCRNNLHKDERSVEKRRIFENLCKMSGIFIGKRLSCCVWSWFIQCGLFIWFTNKGENYIKYSLAQRLKPLDAKTFGFNLSYILLFLWVHPCMG